ncbi:MAG: hypothetical protein ACRD0X_05405, partial [Thermoanaerobaculia bacterium]
MRWSERVTLPAETRVVLAALAAAALPAEPVALVGGFVRDLLLGRETRDLDVVVVGGGAALARRLGERLAAEPRVHPSFDTAELRIGELRVDVASAREERYPAPAALPVVMPAALVTDLGRRDFTVNAMALPLAAGSLAEILDPHQGRTALATRRLTVLHDRSFRDDPTRILRGLELAARLELRFDPETEELARAGAAHLDELSSDRLEEAWDRLFPNARRLAEKLEALDRLGILRRLSPGLAQLPRSPADRLAIALAAPGSGSVPVGKAVLAWLGRRGGSSVELDLARRFGSRELRGLGGRLARAETELSTGRPAHELEAAVAQLGAIELAVLAATSPPAVAE